MLHQPIQTKPIAIGTKAANLAHGYGGNVRVMTEWFTFVNVAEVHLNRGETNTSDRISNRYAGVGVSTRINQNAILLTIASLDAIYQSTLAVRLEKVYRHLKRTGFISQHRLYSRQRMTAVNAGFAQAQQI